MKRPRVIDLFCGAGGFSEGFEQAGYEVVAAVDFNEMALQAHEENHPNTKHHLIEIGEDSTDFLKKYKPDIIIGSPPCKLLSNANPNRDIVEGLELVHEFLEIVKKLKPKFWIGENVATVRKPIEKAFGVPGYILNSANYGVPQTRERYFFGKYPTPTYTHMKYPIVNLDGTVMEPWATIRGAMDPFDHTWGSFEKMPKYARERISKYDYDGEKKLYVVDNYHVFKNQTPQLYIVDSVNTKKTNGMDRVRSIDEQCYTVVCRQNFFICNVKDKLYRKVSVTELARIMGFPEDYQFIGTKFDKIEQIGNAVCPPVAKAIGLACRSLI